MTTEYQPRDLPDLRLRMAEFWNNTDNHPWIHVLDQQEHLSPPDTIRHLANLVHASVTEGQLYYVDSETSHLASNGDLPLLDYGFMPWDLPSPSGLMHFTGMYDTNGTVPAFVLSWVTCQPDETAPHGILQIFVHGPKDEVRQELAADHYRALERFDRDQPAFTLVSGVEVVFAETDTNGGALEYRTHDQTHGWYAFALLAACHLIRQTMAETTDETPDRAARRRHQRAGMKPSSIRVIRMRGSERREYTGESDREWHHRWVVRGHWRRQWYESIQAHRPIWINSFVKGPKDAPVLGGDKVYRV